MASVATAAVELRSRLLWRTAQWSGLALTLALLAGLWLEPEASLRVLWYGVIPLLPAVFLLHPGLWRNVCPLATLNLLPGRLSLGRIPGARLLRGATLLGFALLAVLVPARRFLFNMDGPALALVVAAVALLALVAGFVFDRKAGFCNSICPVLPVEKLYGQQPLTLVGNAHCTSCSVCTPGPCLDLSAQKVVPIAVRRRDRPRQWYFTSYGAFAAAFPGFVLAYYLIPDGTPADALKIYLTVAASAAISYLLVTSLFVILDFSARRALPLIAGGALLLYYWFGAASIAAQWQLGTPLVHTIRTLAILLVGYWLVFRVTRKERGRVAAATERGSGMVSR